MGAQVLPPALVHQLLARMDPNTSYVVTDCRFNNERRVAQSLGCFVVLLKRGLVQSTSQHPSEAEVREMATDRNLFDLVLDNSEGTADENFGRFVDQMQTAREAGRPAGELWRPFERIEGGLSCSGDDDCGRLKREFHECHILAGSRNRRPSGELYSDCVFLLHGDGTLTLPGTELPFDELMLICATLQHAGTELRARYVAEAAASAATARSAPA